MVSGDGKVMIKRKIKIQLDMIINDLNMNLANNYKDLAHDALKKLDETVEQMYQGGELKEKDYEKMKQTVDEYKRKMANYHH